MSLPEPYYRDDEAGITIYHADCREILPLLEPESVDLVLTDPPYGVGLTSFDDDFSVSPHGLVNAPGQLAVVFMSPRRIVEFATAISESWKFERLLWMEKTADLSYPWRSWLTNSESIMVFSRDGAKWPKPKNYRRDVYAVGPWGKVGHPNAKPPSVVRHLLGELCVDAVLDPFMGSGTTLCAAKDLGRKAIGIEIEERYCEIAVQRLAQQVLPLEVA